MRSSPARAILVFVRAPDAGRVKTRLAAEIGAEAALRVYSALARHTVAQAQTLAPEVAVRIHFTPPDAAGRVAEWLGDGPVYLPQGDGNLGRRMQDAFDQAFAAGYARALIIGSDLPELSSTLLREAFNLLDRHPAVLGPARDGGYYLLGLRRSHPEIFRDIAWSTAEVFGETKQRLHAAGANPALLPILRDVDTAADLSSEWKTRCGVTF